MRCFRGNLTKVTGTRHQHIRRYRAALGSALAVLALPGAVCAAPKKAAPVVLYDLSATLRQDLANERSRRDVWDTCHLVAALQGLANRHEARLYLRYLPADDFWWEKLRRPGAWLERRPVERVADLKTLLQCFRGVYHGVVLYDERVPATACLASTLAGMEDLLPVRYDPSPDSLYSRLVAGGPRLPVRRALIGPDGAPLFTGRGKIPGTDQPSTGSAKADAYAWARIHLLEKGKCDPTRMGYYLDAYWLRHPELAAPAHHTLTNHDFFISRHGFFFDLSPWEDEAPVEEPGAPTGADAAALKAILAAAQQRAAGKMIHVGGFVPWAFKYTNYGSAGGTHQPVASEWHYAATLSAYNAFMDADAIGLGAMANASFFQHFPLKAHYPQNPRPDTTALQARGFLDAQGRVVPKQYYAFYVGDYDSAAWLYCQLPRLWEDPARGSVPLNWAFNPNLAERMAPALAYTRATRTANDFFVAGDSGAGYLNPGLLEAPRPSGLPTGIAAWEAHCRRWYQQWDLGITGFIIDGDGPAMSEKLLAAYARFSPDGIVAQKIPRQGVFHDMPFLRMGSDLGGKPEEAARQIAGTLRPPRTTFHVYRTILQSPTWHREVVRQVSGLCPEATVVDLYTLLALVRQEEEDTQRHPECLPFAGATAISTAPRSPDQGLYAVAVADGPLQTGTSGGAPAWQVQPNGEQPRYLYFDAADGFLPQSGPVAIAVEYLDQGNGRLALEYDAADRNAPHDGAYKPAGQQEPTGTGAWKTWSLQLPDARFQGGQNEGSDFRLIALNGPVAIRKVTVRRLR